MFSEDGRPYWSSGFSIVLEKYGYLDHVEADVSSIGADDVHGCSVLLVGRLPEEAWSSELVALIAGAGRPTLLEGPLPQVARELVGVSAADPVSAIGRIVTASPDVRARAVALGYPAGGVVGDPVLSESIRTPLLDWRRLEEVQLTEAQSAAWNARAWDVSGWTTGPDAEVLADWHPDDDAAHAMPAVVRRGHVVATAMSLLGYLVQRHSSPPFGVNEYRTSPRTTGLETLVLAIIDLLHMQGGSRRARVCPWPRGVDWALNVRHDFDRALPPERVQAVVKRHRTARTAATWYWRARHLRPRLRHRLVRPRHDPEAPGGRRGHPGNAALLVVACEPGHEIALHTELLWAGSERERRTIERVIGRPVVGACAHGDPDCFRFQGAPNILWAEANGLEYTESLEHGHLYPHRFPILRADGIIEASRVVCLPHHESFDRSVTPGDVAAEKLLEALPMWVRGSGLLQVMNHPDQNIDELFAMLDEFPRGGRLDWTAREAVEWWRRSHQRECLSLSIGEAGRIEASSQHGVDTLAVEVLQPDGVSSRLVVDLEPRDPNHGLERSA